ncbi:MAG: beta-lactamase family protein [Myxococcales bacterium]|nr:beta-lactamase family protein [Myxococcales bacterium]
MSGRAPAIHAALQRLVETMQQKPACGEVLLAVRAPREGVEFFSHHEPRQFFIASATKLYVTALMAKLRERGVVDWAVPMARYLPDLDLRRLAVYKQTDVTERITVADLLAHTSGLPDYFEGRRADGATTFGRALAHDMSWNLADVITWTRELQRPHFMPGTPGRALYSDTNYQLLGAIIERQYGASFADVVEAEICRPLGLRDTYCFAPPTIARYQDVCAMKLGDRALNIPLAMASVGADGGIVSTLADSMAFLKAFGSGALFSQHIYRDIQAPWRRIFFPLRYGTGVMLFRTPWIFSPFRRFPDLIGHSGASGTVMFYAEAWDTYVVATVNQVAQRSLPYQLMMRALAIAAPAARD